MCIRDRSLARRRTAELTCWTRRSGSHKLAPSSPKIIHHGRKFMKTADFIAAASALLLSGMASAAEIKVVSTQATQEAYLELVAQFERATGHKVTTVFTGTLNVQKRLADGEAYDLIIMAGPAIDEQIKLGKTVAGLSLIHISEPT